MIEVNKRLYMNEQTLERSEAFEKVRESLSLVESSEFRDKSKLI